MEIWKDIAGYEGLYQVSNWGRVRSFGNGKNYKYGRILKQSKNGSGYLFVCLCKNGKKKNYTIHRLVSETFIPNPDNLPQVNHKDENKNNNFCGTPENDFTDGNLEWCTPSYNSNYGTRNKRASEKKTNGKMSKSVIQYTLDGEFVKEWVSLHECSRNGFHHQNIIRCCRGKYKQYKGYIWKYKKEVV